MGRKRLFNDKEKWCNKCKKFLPLGAFGDNRRNVSGKQDYCKTCHSPYSDTFWGKVKSIDKTLKEKFNMEPGDYLNQWRAQDKKCAVCQDALILYQRDTHVHVVKETKLLLCAKCDVGLSAFRDDLSLLEKAAKLLGPRL
jgi:hypothetical protein